MTVSLATPCVNCSHPLNIHDMSGRTCIACSCENYRPDVCHDGHVQGCEHATQVANPDRTKFETKDSGVRAEYESGMVRDTDSGKARFELLLPLGVPYEDQFLTRVAELMARGAEKYDSRNWEQARSEEEMERFKSSALRHLMQWAAGETDEDHAAAVVFNLLGYETTRWRVKEE